RCDERQPGGHERAEGDEQDDRGRDDPEELRRALAVGEGDDPRARAAVLDLQLRAARREGGLLDLLEHFGLDVVRALLVVDVGHGEAAALREPATLRARAL